MILPELRIIFSRDLHKLKQEIDLYQNEEAIWRIAPGIANSAGNLCLHLVGNLNTYIGTALGHIPYIRHRELEFSSTGIAKNDLMEAIEATLLAVDAAFEQLQEPQLADEYPALVLETKTSIGYMLMHLATHLTYHLGQINYHRRLLQS